MSPPTSPPVDVDLTVVPPGWRPIVTQTGRRIDRVAAGRWQWVAPPSAFERRLQVHVAPDEAADAEARAVVWLSERDATCAARTCEACGGPGGRRRGPSFTIYRDTCGPPPTVTADRGYIGGTPAGSPR